jgi:cold shock protein
MRYNIKGVCKIFHIEEGWGWISVEREDDVWVHFSSIQMAGVKTLNIGETVLFDLEENPNLKDQSRRAVNVKKIENTFNKNKS